MLQSVAVFYALLCLGTVFFQFALIAGAPWGPVTQGGNHPGALPASGRIIAGVSVFVLAFMALSIMSAAGLWPNWPQWTGWVGLTIQGLSAVLNIITRSLPERKLWAPITSLMFVLALSVMLVF